MFNTCDTVTSYFHQTLDLFNEFVSKNVEVEFVCHKWLKNLMKNAYIANEMANKLNVIIIIN